LFSFDSLQQKQDQGKGTKTRKPQTIETLNSNTGHRTNNKYKEHYQNPKIQFQETKQK
jgi:hypothetical protein